MLTSSLVLPLVWLRLGSDTFTSLSFCLRQRAWQTLSHRRSLLWVGFTLTLQGSRRFQSRLPPKWQRRHTRMVWLRHIRSLRTRRLTSGHCSTITTMKGRQTCPSNGHARFTWDQNELGLKIIQFRVKLGRVSHKVE